MTQFKNLTLKFGLVSFSKKAETLVYKILLIWNMDICPFVGYK